MTAPADIDVTVRRRVYAALMQIPGDQLPAVADWLERLATADERLADPGPEACPRCRSTDLSRVSVPLPMSRWKRLVLRRRPVLVDRLRCRCGREIRPLIGPVKP